MSYFFSIFIAVYNTEDYLPRALDSILAQTFDSSKIEVVIVNDASPKTAQCDEIVKEYSSKLAINYVKNEVNQGLIAARMLGVENSSKDTKYLLSLDPDDYLEKKACSVLYEDIQKNGDADYIEFNYYELNKNTKKKKITSKNLSDRNIREILSFEQHHTFWNKCYNSSFIKNVFKNMESIYASFNTDYYQVRIISYYAKNTRFIKTPLYTYIIEIGISNVKKCDKERLRKVFISMKNIEEHLCDFYQDKKPENHIPAIKNFSEFLYDHILYFNDSRAFFDVFIEILGIERFKTFFAYHIEMNMKHVDNLNTTIKAYQKKMKWLLPIKLLIKPFRSLYRFCKKHNKKEV